MNNDQEIDRGEFAPCPLPDREQRIQDGDLMNVMRQAIWDTAEVVTLPQRTEQSGWRKVQIDDAEEEAWKEMEKASAMREVQRLSQEIEQKPVAWGVFDTQNLHDMFFTKGEAQDMARLKGDGSIVKPLYTHLPKENT